MSALVMAGVFLAAFVLQLAAFAVFTAYTARQVERALPPAGKFVEIGGGRIHYVEQGQGPALLMIHGLGGHARMFTHSLADRLARDYRVMVMDRPGSGHSTRARGASAGPLSQARTVASARWGWSGVCSWGTRWAAPSRWRRRCCGPAASTACPRKWSR